MRKGLDQPIWLIIVIIIGLAVVLILILMVNAQRKSVETQSIGIIDTSGTTIIDQIGLAKCQATCSSCCATEGEECKAYTEGTYKKGDGSTGECIKLGECTCKQKEEKKTD